MSVCVCARVCVCVCVCARARTRVCVPQSGVIAHTVLGADVLRLRQKPGGGGEGRPEHCQRQPRPVVHHRSALPHTRWGREGGRWRRGEVVVEGGGGGGGGGVTIHIQSGDG